MNELISRQEKDDIIKFAKEITKWTLEEKQTALAIITGMNLQKKLDIKKS